MKRKIFLTILIIMMTVPLFSIELNIAHLEFLRDEFSIEGERVIGYWIYSDLKMNGTYQHVSAIGEGATCVDDVARVAIFYLRQLKTDPANNFYDSRAREALNFLFKFQRNDGDFYNFVFENGTINKNGPTSRAGGNWWAARAFWALSLGAEVYAKIDSDYSFSLAARAKKVFRVLKRYIKGNLLKGYTDMSSVMLLGACELQRVDPDEKTFEVIQTLATGLLKSLDNSHGELLGLFDEGKKEFNWHGWGSRQIEALIEAYKVTGNEAYLKAAEKSANKLFPLIVSAGPLYSISRNIKMFPQIAYAAEVFVNSSARLYEVTKEPLYAYYTLLLGAWFKGLNLLKAPMIGPDGQGYDGLEITHRNLNSGAESTISALLALQAVRTLPAEYQVLFEEAKELLTPAFFEEAEKFSLGLSDATIENSNTASGGALVRCQGTTALRKNLSLPGVPYRMYISIPSFDTAMFLTSLRYGKEKIKREINLDHYGLFELGTVNGSAAEERLTIGLDPTNGDVEIDALIFVPLVIGIYFETSNQTLVINNSDKDFKGIEPGRFTFLSGKAVSSEISRRVETNGQVVEVIKEGEYFLIDLSPFYNNNGIVNASHRREGNFDNIQGIVGASYPMEEVQKSISGERLRIDGIPFLFSDKGKDNLRTQKQHFEIDLKAQELWVLGSSDHGDYTGELIIQYKNGQQESFILGFSDWCGKPRYGEKALQFSYRYDSTGNRENLNCKFYLQHIKLKGGEIKAIILPDVITMHIFGITLK
ncbi:hypothetical protein [Kosmotoga pacifica]|uniref:D-glucuronyl C5-epimerase C-terminal domain-containing protein n=1 Tax=Kosmotoga pacifica TaxID=1330330 RepID=A0A0G2Z9J0_9BACT|nr:hypothetical protein [Kosmotoga pacifica]AKI98280.1 hypothetical protein IX53_05450 [Kosmotoga pacifica]